MGIQNKTSSALNRDNVNARLDHVLSVMNSLDLTAQSGEQLLAKARITMDPQELTMLLFKLERDGYITWLPHKTGGEYSQAKSFFHKNVEGILHQCRGGYTKQSRRLRALAVRNQVEVWSVILGGAGGTVALLYFLRKLGLYLLDNWFR